ncbi:MAG: XRE family transcriptional regulator [Candidatus Kerfeldbacteria bacterium]
MTKQEAYVEPAILRWAREKSSLPSSLVAKRVGVPPERLDEWEQGKSRPTVRQTRVLARIYGHLALAVFYLPEPPRDFTPLKDFRRLATATPQSISPELLFEYRSAQDRREIALSLFEELREEPPTFTLTAHVGENVASVAARIRSSLEVSYETQKRWHTNNEAFNAWRASLEGAGVLVFQAVGIAVREMRGLSISDRPLPAVVVNRKDAYAGRIFSALHEVAHIMLRGGGVCDMRDDRRLPPDELAIEMFCNAVAGETIVPSETLSHERIVAAHSNLEWTDDELARLAQIYSTSKEVVLRRLLSMRRTTDAFYRRKREQFIRELEDQERSRGKKTKPGFLTPDVEVVSQTGKGFVRLTLEAFRQGRITASTLSDYLGVRLKHIPSIEEMVQTR